MKIKEIMKKYKKLSLAITLLISLIVVFMGGAKLMIYFALLITGLFFGSRYERFRRIYQDYKLGLQVNSILVSQKQFTAQKDELEQLKQDLKHANERINLYKSTRVNMAALSQLEQDDENHDDQHSHRFARLR